LNSKNQEVNILFRPLKNKEIDSKALEITHRTEKEIWKFPHSEIGIAKLKNILSKFVNPYKPEDKFVPAGFNVMFDLGFLRNLWFQVGDTYGPGSYFFNCPLDVRSDVARMILCKNMHTKNFKLTTVCDYCGINIGVAHDPMNDIKATRKVSIFINNEIYGKKNKNNKNNNNKR